ncbi:MAG TPA: hypothetical protein VKZ18_24395 [Polyangia bacterium]|nr:hypothetical protein [Polyangia bacterium]
MSPPDVSDDEKRQALARVLGSRTFGRSDQLRGFLRYVCEAELEGRAHQLNEYALGVSVLGRPDGYSPAEDSGVRSRAYELRNKLKSYYNDEAPGDPLQIEIEKGAYVPRFRRRTSAGSVAPPPAAPPPPAIPAQAAADVGPPAARRPSRRVAAAVAGLLVGLLIVGAYRATRPTTAGGGLAPRAASREMEALWKPFLDGNAPLLISFEVRMFLFAPATGLVVRDFQANHKDDIARSKALAAFREHMGTDELVETYDYADVGAVQAAFLLGHILNRDAGLKYASALGWEDIWNSNVVFVGKSNVNPAIRKVLREGDLDFVDSEFGSAVRNLHPAPGELPEYRNAATHGAGKKYGVITVLPGPQPGRHMMLLTGSGAELMWALAQSVADPAREREIVAHLVGPAGEVPASFQILIEATFESNVPISIRYVTHHVYRAK